MAPMTSKMNTRRTLMMVMMGITMMMMLSIQGTRAATGDQGLMEVLYNKVLDVMVPGPAPSTALPPQILLLEGGGLAIRREDYDSSLWSANNFVSSMPSALAARLVDRVPRYIGTSFIDSGVRVSQLWNNLLSQFVVPVIDNPVVNARVAQAQAQLANGTLDQNVLNAISSLQATYDEVQNNRDECLKRKDPDTCARNAVLWAEKRSRSWYNFELAKRSAERVDATLIALQTQDLKGIFASALQSFSTFQKIDMGAATFGTPFWDTSFTPSNWWQWFPLDNTAYNVIVPAGQPYIIPLQPFSASGVPARIITQPTHGSATIINNQPINNITYVPNAGYTGADTIAYVDNNSPRLITIVIGVQGSDITGSNPAFTSLFVSSRESASAATSVFNRLQVSEVGDFDNGAIRLAGGFDTSSLAATSMITSTTTTIQFDIAKVAINRPWLDPSLLAYYPVALSGLPKYAWSDGTVFPNRRENTIQQLFKVLPVAMVVARNIRITSASLASTYSSAISTSTSASVGRIQVGPFAISSSSTTSSAVNGATITIAGPQILGWIVSPMPAFPTASEDEVAAYERARSIPSTPTFNTTNVIQGNTTTNTTASPSPTPTPTTSPTPTPTPTPTPKPAQNGTNSTNTTQ